MRRKVTFAQSWPSGKHGVPLWRTWGSELSTFRSPRPSAATFTCHRCQATSRPVYGFRQAISKGQLLLSHPSGS